MVTENRSHCQQILATAFNWGAGQNCYRIGQKSGGLWEGFAILLPEEVELAVFQEAANVQDVLCALDSPEHA
jgi:hypothetical protein